MVTEPNKAEKIESPLNIQLAALSADFKNLSAIKTFRQGRNFWPEIRNIFKVSCESVSDLSIEISRTFTQIVQSTSEPESKHLVILAQLMGFLEKYSYEGQVTTVSTTLAQLKRNFIGFLVEYKKLNGKDLSAIKTQYSVAVKSNASSLNSSPGAIRHSDPISFD